MTVLEMMEKRNQAWTAAKNFAKAHKNEQGVLSDEDYATYQKMEKEIEDMSREISRMQKDTLVVNFVCVINHSAIWIKPCLCQIYDLCRLHS